MMSVSRWAVLILMLVLHGTIHADELKLSGGPLSCKVLQENQDSVSVLYGEAILRFNRAQIFEIKRSVESTTEYAASDTLIPPYVEIVSRLAKQTWAIDLHQIPATVIDVGILRSVPYKSHRVATDCEVNVYGDPRNPSGVEVGLLGKFVNHETAKSRCIEFVASLFADAADRAIITALKREKDLVVRDKLTFEITPSSAADAYGGWWISVYNEKALDGTRATEQELATITSGYQRPMAASARRSPKSQTDHRDLFEWNSNDFQFARTPQVPADNSSGGGRVYVKGYYRKDGTYVHPHTRSR